LWGITSPGGFSPATVIGGGGGGTLVGISSIDGSDASENPTTKFITFATDKWYRVRLRVTSKKLEAWLDDKPIVDQEIADRKISLRPGDISMSVPIGIATYQTSAAFRAIRLRALP
jgi:hypothetical protein